ncbi:MAG: methyltransferase domain-containing protein [Phycisphaeraceae bacterium]|nr:methyltransferase domain-containing protein [Phycisphaeraceae bacterium]
MYIKLDEQVESLLCCPFCKGDLAKSPEVFTCTSCGLKFPSKVVAIDGETSERVFDFRIHHPDYCLPSGAQQWGEAQSEFEAYHEKHSEVDSYQEYLDEIESVREIYTEEYDLKGSVLDVGGNQGRLRHFLGDEADLYVAIDPYIDVFSGMPHQPSLLRAYPCLSEPCNFIAAYAEYLPFKTGSFDWIHMRSVVDHFKDPYLSFVEAYRCSKVGGKILVGLSIIEKKQAMQQHMQQADPKPNPSALPIASIPGKVVDKLKGEGVTGLLRSVIDRVAGVSDHGDADEDDHMFRFTHASLQDLYMRTGWHMTKEHWQKPPYQFVIYACGEKKQAMPDAS